MAIHAIRSLYFPQFRILLYSHTLISTAFWLQQIIIGWLVYDVTKSPLLTTLAVGIDTIPVLFGGFIGGSIVDRFNPKHLIIFVIATQFILVVILAALMYSGFFSIWYIYPLVFCMGASWVVYDPAKITLGMQIVDVESVPNIFGMWICGFNLPRIISSLLAGYLIVFVGVKFAVLIEASVIFLALLSILLMNYQHTPKVVSSLNLKAIYSDLINLVAIIKRNDILIGVLLLSLIPILFLIPSITGLLPVYASEKLNLDARGLGVLQAFSGVGQIVGIFSIGMFRQNKMGRYAISAIYLAGCFGILFAFSNTFYMSLIFVMFVNFCIAIFHNTASSILFMNIDANYRGRLAGLQVSSFGLFTLGSVFAGALAGIYGVTLATTVGMILVFAMATFVSIKYNSIFTNY